MNKIKEKLIHLLGGLSEHEYNLKVKHERTVGELMAYNTVLCIMKEAYGMPADQWAKHVYEETEKVRHDLQCLNSAYKDALRK